MPSIDLCNVSVEFPIYTAKNRSIRTDLLQRIGGRIHRDTADKRVVVQALRNINLSLKSGDRLGLIGPNGAGKSTLLRVIAGIYEPLRGTVMVEGGVSPLFDTTLGIDSELTGYENIILRSVLLGRTIKEARENMPAIAAFSELEEFLDLPMRTYSAGMSLRLSFAISTAHTPDILLLDEIVAAGDATFSLKARTRMRELVEKASILVLALHEASGLRDYCNKLAVLRGGEITDLGPVDEVLERYFEGAERAYAE
jgi:ABC-2 type transport system ATP-binding protein/lipopolysaccharide transport system ATP-binding protein